YWCTRAHSLTHKFTNLLSLASAAAIQRQMIDRQNGGRAAHVRSSASGGTSPSTSAPGPTALTYRYFLAELRGYCGLLIGKGHVGGASRLALLFASLSSVSIHSAGKSSVSLVLYFKTNS